LKKSKIFSQFICIEIWYKITIKNTKSTQNLFNEINLIISHSMALNLNVATGFEWGKLNAESIVWMVIMTLEQSLDNDSDVRNYKICHKYIFFQQFIANRISTKLTFIYRIACLTFELIFIFCMTLIYQNFYSSWLYLSWKSSELGFNNSFLSLNLLFFHSWVRIKIS
jgi:hypothetical protein